LRIFCFEGEFRHIGVWVDNRMKEPGQLANNEQPLGPDGLSALEARLARSFQLRMPLHSIIQREDNEILILTDQQFQILDGFCTARRLAISGGAGTGKTMLAFEKARRSSAAKQQTLLVCYNRPLADALARAASGQKHLQSMNFHELCRLMRHQAGLADLHPEASETTVATGLAEAVALVPSAFDAIIVDEGQDFHPSWWEPLRQCLKLPETGLLWVFYDDRQHVQPWPSNWIAAMPQCPFRLTRNLRNTKEIFSVASGWFGNCFILPAGPHGHPVEWCEISGTSAYPASLCSCIDRLIRLEKLPPGDITVLFRNESDIARFVTNLDLCGNRAARTGAATDAIRIETIRRFKGLESPVVILCLTGESIPEEELLYVALTRARAHLLVIGCIEVCELLRRRAQSISSTRATQELPETHD